MATVKVLVQKINCGVRFELCDKRLKATSKTWQGSVGSRAIAKVQELYKAEVQQAFIVAGINTTGYAEDFEQNWYNGQEYDDRGATKNLEPWGFAIVGEDGTLHMNDTGSTPTSFRTKMLACYQAPLAKVRVDDSRCRFEKVYEVEV